MKRLVRNAKHDLHNRDNAIVVFGNEVYEDITHSICLQKYIDNNNFTDKVFLGHRPDVEKFEKVSKNSGGQYIILAHRVENYDTIYYIYGFYNGEQMEDSAIETSLKKLFPDKKIVNDLDHEDDGNNEGYDKEKNIEKGNNAVEEFEKNRDSNNKNDIATINSNHSNLGLELTSFYGEPALVNKSISINLYDMNDSERNEFGTIYNVDMRDICKSMIKNGQFKLNKLDQLLTELENEKFKTTELLEANGYIFNGMKDDSTFLYNKNGIELEINCTCDDFTFSSSNSNEQIRTEELSENILKQADETL